MQNHISLTIPRDDNDALVAGATMLLTLAGKVPTLELPNASVGKWENGGSPDYPNIVPMRSSEAIEKGDAVTIAPAPAAPMPDQNEIKQHIAAATSIPSEHLFGDNVTTAPGKPEPSVRPDPANGVTNVELDARGLPWDERIHAGTKSKTADGNWKKKRGVDAAVIEQIEQELVALMAIPSPAVPAAPVPAAPTSPDDALAALEAMEAERTGAPTPPPADSETYPEYSDKPLSEWRFPDFLKAVSKAIVAGNTTMDAAHATCAKHGVQNMHLIGTREDLIPTIWKEIVSHG